MISLKNLNIKSIFLVIFPHTKRHSLEKRLVRTFTIKITETTVITWCIKKVKNKNKHRCSKCNKRGWVLGRLEDPTKLLFLSNCNSINLIPLTISDHNLLSNLMTSSLPSSSFLLFGNKNRKVIQHLQSVKLCE